MNDAADPVMSQDPSTEKDPAEVRKHRILYVEDSVTQRAATCMLLESAGFEVHEAASGVEALQKTRELRPDLVLLDVVLPDSNGYDICQQLKTEAETADTVVLLVSSLGARARERTRGLAAGADGYLRKPVDPEELEASIYALLRIRYAEDRAASAQRQLAAILDLCEDAIICTDRKAAVLAWSPAAQRLFGYSPQEMQGASMSRLVAGESACQQQELWQRVLEGETLHDQVVSRTTKSGAPLRVAITLSPIRDETGQVIGVCELARKAGERGNSGGLDESAPEP